MTEPLVELLIRPSVSATTELTGDDQLDLAGLSQTCSLTGTQAFRIVTPFLDIIRDLEQISHVLTSGSNPSERRPS